MLKGQHSSGGRKWLPRGGRREHSPEDFQAFRIEIHYDGMGRISQPARAVKMESVRLPFPVGMARLRRVSRCLSQNGISNTVLHQLRLPRRINWVLRVWCTLPFGNR